MSILKPIDLASTTIVYLLQKKLGINLAYAAILACAVIASATPEGKPSLNISVTQPQFRPTGLNDGVNGEIQAALAYGGFARGPHRTFLKLPPGVVSPIRTLTDDYYAVAGVGVNTQVGAPIFHCRLAAIGSRGMVSGTSRSASLRMTASFSLANRANATFFRAQRRSEW